MLDNITKVLVLYQLVINLVRQIKDNIALLLDFKQVKQDRENTLLVLEMSQVL